MEYISKEMSLNSREENDPLQKELQEFFSTTSKKLDEQYGEVREQTIDMLESHQLFDAISKCNESTFTASFFQIRKILAFLYDSNHYFYGNETEDKTKNITKIENIIAQKIEEFNLPYVYEYLFGKDRAPKIVEPMIGEKYEERRISKFEMSEPTIISDKYGKDHLVLSYGGKLKEASIDQEDEIKSWLGYSQMYSHNYYSGLQEVYERFFKKEIDLSLFNLSESDLYAYTIYLGDSFQSIIKDFFGEGISEKEKDSRYIKNLVKRGREGLFFSKFLSTCSKDNFFKLKSFSTQYGFSGLKTFLSIAHGGQEMGDKILTLGELPEKLAKDIFSKYGEIIDSAEKVEEEIQRMYEKESIPADVIDSLKQILLKKGAKLLVKIAEDIQNQKQIDEKYIFDTLDEVKLASTIMGSSYKELYKQHILVPLEDIATTSLETISVKNLSEEEKHELKKAYKQGRPKETYESEEHLALLEKEFEQTLENEKTSVFIIRLEKEIVAFATFYEESINTIHMGGLTFIPDVRNPAIGYAVMETIMSQFGNQTIKALVHSENTFLTMYKKRFGFVVTKELPREENAGELYYEIQRLPSQSISAPSQI